jgi:hypothetical protein
LPVPLPSPCFSHLQYPLLNPVVAVAPLRPLIPLTNKVACCTGLPVMAARCMHCRSTRSAFATP